MSHKIACVCVHDAEFGYGDYYDSQLLLSVITDFQEVDDETFTLLKEAQRFTTPRFMVVELLDDSFIGRKVDEYKELAKKWAEERRAQEEKERQRKAALEAKRKKKNQEKKADRIAKLQAELAELQDGRE